MFRRAFNYSVFPILLFLQGLLHAAEIVPGNIGKVPTITIQGEIRSGDYNKLRAAFIKSYPLSPLIYLDSPGGDISEAIKIGKLIRFVQATVFVKKNKTCASACFFIYLGGASRLAAGAMYGQPLPLDLAFGYVGLHRPFLSNPSATDESLELQAKVMRKIRTYLDANLVPARLIDIMMSRPSTDIYWLSDSDLEDLGDIPPELEELYISQCNYNRNLIKNYSNAKQGGNIALIQRLKNEMTAVNKCIADSTAAMGVERLEKLKAGWQP